MGNAFELLELGGLIYTELTLGSTNGFEMWNPEGRGGGKRRGLGPRNDVLPTCKAVTQRGGQRGDFLEVRSEPAEEIRNA